MPEGNIRPDGVTTIDPQASPDECNSLLRYTLSPSHPLDMNNLNAEEINRRTLHLAATVKTSTKIAIPSPSPAMLPLPHTPLQPI